MRTFIVLGVLFLLNSGALFSQLNESDTVKFQFRTSFGGNYQKGNVELLLVRAKLDCSAGSNKKIVFKTQNSSLYQSFYSKKADNDVFSRNYLYWKPVNRIYPFAIGYVSANYRRKVNLRVFAGLGGTLQLINTHKHVLKISAGAVYEESTFSGIYYNYGRYNGSKSMKLYRATTYLGGWNYLFKNKIRFYYDAYWQPSSEDSENYRWQADVGLDFIFWKGLSFNVLFIYTHENITIQNIKQADQFLSFGLAYNFKTQK